MTAPRILVVEDESIVAMDIEDGLTRHGYQVVGVAATAAEAVRLAETTHPDIVIMDIRLKGPVDGIAAALQIRAQTRTPVIFLTANIDEGTLRRAMAADPFGYLAKPFDEHDLHRAIELALHKHRAEEDHRRATAEALRASEEPFRVVVNAVKDFAIFLLNLDGIVVSWNHGAEHIEGYAPDEILGRHFSVFFPPEVSTRGPAGLLDRASREGEAAEEGWLIRKDGSRFWATIVVSAVYDTKDRMTGFSMIVRDVSERRAFQGELQSRTEQLRSLSSRLIAVQEEERKNIAREVHDQLGQGLTALKLNVAALAQSLPAAVRKSTIADVQRINDLIDRNIKDIRRISAELRPIGLDQFGLSAAVQLAVDTLQSQTAIECDVSIRPEDIQPPAATAIVIYRILQEALTNVVRHANATRVEVRLRQDDRLILLEVRDNGAGISSAQLAAPDALGLIGMRERAALIGGDLRIEGVPGKGTIVSLRAPLGASS